ncbi:MAG: LPXTG cell wall anchor domain-containing protein [Nitrosomonas sp.]|nr:LPXTG cell wall anchor domain-containing protein [Nitrosomonas sp.]
MTVFDAIQAHGGLSLADDLCTLTIGPYTMHFTGYQPESSQEQEFCEDIPVTGRTVVALDYINEELRPMTTEVRVIRDVGSEENIDSITVFHIPPKVYSNGSVTLEHNFPEPGKFVGLVTIKGEKDEYVSRFPFAVGTGGKSNLPYILGALAIAAGIAFFFLKSNKKA